jgi:hypothetical protein
MIFGIVDAVQQLLDMSSILKQDNDIGINVGAGSHTAASLDRSSLASGSAGLSGVSCPT